MTLEILVTYFVPILLDLPLFGTYLHKHWLWSVNVSPGFVGSGIITGPAVAFHMFAGAVVGWAIFSPIAKKQGWAPGNVDDWENGSRGWIIWISLAALLADCLIKLGWLVLRPLLRSSAVRIYLRVRERSHEYSWVLPIQTEDHEDEDSLASSMHSQEDEAPSPVEACTTVSPQLIRQSEKHEDRMKV